MKIFSKILFLVLTLLSLQLAKAAENAEQIIKRADDIRNPSESYMMEVLLSGSEGEEDSRFEVYLKGNDKTLVKTLAPKRDVGRNMLMLEENMWLYIPNLKRSVRISLAQKLSGQASNGDISRMRWYGDYRASIMKEDKKSWTIHLEALKKGLTYEKINAVIEKKSYRPLSATYLSLNDMPLKNVIFSEFKKMEGKERPAKLIISEATNKNKSTTLSIVTMKKMNLPDTLFNKNTFK